MKLGDIIKEIDQNQEQINAYGKLDIGMLQKINYKFRLDWNYYSNRMEGGTLTREETRSVMVGNIDVKGKPLKDVMEMNGHDRMVLDVLKMGKGEDKLSEKRIKAIHKAIMYEEDAELSKGIGEWKTTPNEIINYKGEKIPFAPPSEVKESIHKLLDKTKAELEKYLDGKPSRHPLEIAAQFHVDFVTIHPFYDGNGRTTRILTNLLLISCGFPPIIVREQHKKSYYQLLADIQVYGGQPDLFYTFLGERLIESQELILSALRGEEIEEQDDLEKEINLWKKQLAPVSKEEIARNDESVKEVYKNSVRPLFESFLIGHQRFDDLFNVKTVTNKIHVSQAKTVREVEFFDLWLFYIEKYLGVEKIPSNELTLTLVSELATLKAECAALGLREIQNVRSMELKIRYDGFEKSARSFNASAGLKVMFNDFNYVVADPMGKQYFRKLYSETITGEEISTFVKDRVREFFESIKKSIEQSNK